MTDIIFAEHNHRTFISADHNGTRSIPEIQIQIATIEYDDDNYPTKVIPITTSLSSCELMCCAIRLRSMSTVGAKTTAAMSAGTRIHLLGKMTLGRLLPFQ